MTPEEAKEFVATDTELTSAEKEFSLTFTKDDERALFSSSVASMVKRALTHTDMEVNQIGVLDTETEEYWNTTVSEFDGEGRIVSCKGRVPIESLKIQSNPRSTRSYASIISPQKEVSIDSNT